ncbi:hypothetical protein QN277_001262 [Acacia crassicarpa]|uniref:Gnk2-homologous domain-containing protein n=1 Tax=Acacia crassicarpa TaxID=499986 RepID=A0AAE1N8C4_9FABA|nr:hypothetical protein QN277_001262 [Acacia crassicarpa]
MPIVFLVLISFLSHLPILTAQTHLPILTAQIPIFHYNSCFPEEGKYTNSSTYQTNLNIVLSDLTSNAEIDYGFYNMSWGQNPDRVSAIGLCRGDTEPNSCRTCLKNASVLAQDACPNQMEAMGGYDECFVRYSNRSILGVLDKPDFWLYSWTGGNKPADPVKYNQEAKELLEDLRVKAAAGDSLRKYAAANKSGLQSQTIYGTVQCTPDLSHQNCSECLSRAIANISNPCCSDKGIILNQETSL